MSTQFLERCIEEENLRDKIRASLPENKIREINHLFAQLEKIWWAKTVPAFHAMFLSPAVTLLIVFAHCYFYKCSLRNDLWFLLGLSSLCLFFTYKAAFHFLAALYENHLNQIQQEIAQDFKKNVALWELLWLIRAKSCERDREIATQVTQKLLAQINPD